MKKRLAEVSATAFTQSHTSLNVSFIEHNFTFNLPMFIVFLKHELSRYA